MDSTFIKRPLFIISASVMVTSMFVMLLLPTLIAVLCCLVIVATSMLISSLLFRVSGKRLYKSASLILLGVLVSLSSYSVNFELKKAESKSYYGIHSIEGYITDISYNSDSGAACFMTLTRIDGKKKNINTYCLFDEKIPDIKYSTISFNAEISDIEIMYDGMTSERTFSASGIFLSVQACSLITEKSDSSANIKQFFGKLNRKICSYISTNFDEQTAGVINALLFGDRSGLDAGLSRDFRTLGITHMLVVSGMNIALIAGEIESIFKILRIKRPIRILSCVLICILYMALCGFALSVVRAALMQILCRISVLFKRQNDSYTSLFFSMAVILTFSPGAIFDVGLLLSFFATLGLISFPDNLLPDVPYNRTGDHHKENKSVRKLKRVLKSVLSSVLSGMFACIFTLPICYSVFGEMSIIGPFATCLFSVFLDILLFMTPLFLMSSLIPFIGSIIAFVMTLLCRAVISLITNLAPILQDLLVPLHGDLTAFLILMLIFSSVFAISAKVKKKYLRVTPAIFLWLVISLVALFSGGNDGVIYFNSDKSEAVIINCDGYSTVIDISTGTRSFTRKTSSVLLSSLGNTNTDELILTHLHARHISQVQYLATNGYLKKVIMPESADDDEKSIIDGIITLSKHYGFEYEIYENINHTERLFLKNHEFETSVRFSGKFSLHQEIMFNVKVFDKEMVYISSSDIPFYVETPKLQDADAVIFGSHLSSDYLRPLNLIFDESKSYIFANRDIRNNVTSIPYVTVSEKETPVRVFK